MKNLLATAAAILLTTPALAAGPPPIIAGTPTPVIITNPTNDPASTSVTNPGDIAAAVAKALGVGTPVDFELDFQAPPGNGQSNPFTVPADKRLIIEFASGSCLVTNGRFNALLLQVFTSSTVSTYTLGLEPLNAPTDTTSNGTFSHLVKIYAPPLSQITVVVSESQGLLLSCGTFFSGQLVDVP
jgi:hypothetical protein